MPLDQELLDILRCPETRQTLTVADEVMVADLNKRIGEGTLTTRAGEKIEEPIDGALVREDGKYAYVVRDDIPEMLIDLAIALES
ncbi:MAG: Trm112 family protein [Armatimonadetes bacterium]|nr:Trm112 family protein [Armatimonadota bacterium]